MTKRASAGVTLIELLLVVAIIAVLAMVAVPNFLEAQVRAKITRSKANMRSLASAIEAYAADYGRIPLGSEALKAVHFDSPIPEPDVNAAAQSCLTTPIGYLSGFVLDPFRRRTGGGADRHGLFVYQSYLAEAGLDEYLDRVRARDFCWSLLGNGPVAGEYESIVRLLSGEGDPATIYDPTNGAISEGYIVRTNKGDFSYRRHF